MRERFPGSRDEVSAAFTLLGGHRENFGSIYPGFPMKTGFEKIFFLRCGVEECCSAC